MRRVDWLKGGDVGKFSSARMGMGLHLGGSKEVLTVKGIVKINMIQDGNNWYDTSDSALEVQLRNKPLGRVRSGLGSYRSKHSGIEAIEAIKTTAIDLIGDCSNYLANPRGSHQNKNRVVLDHAIPD